MVSHNSSVSGSSIVLPKREHGVVDTSQVNCSQVDNPEAPQKETKDVKETDATCARRNEEVSIPLKPAGNPDEQPEASINDSVKVLCAQAISSQCNPVAKTEDEFKHSEKQLAETETPAKEGVMTTDTIKLEAEGVQCASKPCKREDTLLLEVSNPPVDIPSQAEERQEHLAPSHGAQQVVPLPGIVVHPSPMAQNPPSVSIQPRYLCKEEYLAAVMTSTLADFTNPPNHLILDAFAHGKYEHLLGYATALDEAGQISSPQEVIILATAQCFRPLGILREVNQSFDLTANILKHCHSFARGHLLRFLQVMLERAPAAFRPRGEAFIPILDGFGAVLGAYSEVLPLATQARTGRSDNGVGILERWRVERENSAFTLGILHWFARQPAHWASMNGSQMLVMALSELLTEPGLDRGIHGMIIDFVSLNSEFLPSVDMYMPQNVVLDTILSTLEHAAGRMISSLQYPEYMTVLQLSVAEAEPVLSVSLVILYHYSSMIPRESLVLPRFVGLMTDLLGDESLIRYRPVICYTMKQLFERFPDEFDVCDNFIKKLGVLLSDDVCRDRAVCMLRIIQEHQRNHEEGKTI